MRYVIAFTAEYSDTVDAARDIVQDILDMSPAVSIFGSFYGDGDGTFSIQFDDGEQAGDITFALHLILRILPFMFDNVTVSEVD